MTAAPAYLPQPADATSPPEHRGIARDAVRMLVSSRAARERAHLRFYDLPSVLRRGDVLVVNDSATLPAALTAHRSDGETLALHVATQIDTRVWTAEPRGRVRRGERLALPGGAHATMLAPLDPQRPRLWYALFELPQPMHEYLARFGEPVRYGYVSQHFELHEYQTMFARVPGSAEMPSAARPFTPRVVDALRERGIGIATITLHCGVSSFEAPELPPAERFSVSRATAETVNAARRGGRRVIAIGTTVVRALESAVQDGEAVAAFGWTDLIVDGSRPPVCVDGLLTGFHDATATHQWMLAAFADRALLDSAYAQAARLGYRRHEFGDVHLIL